MTAINRYVLVTDGTDDLDINADGSLPISPASGATFDVSDRAARDLGKVDVALLDQYTPVDVDTDVGDTSNAMPVAVMLPGATPVAAPGDVTNGLDVDVTRLPSLVAGTAVIGKARLVTEAGHEVTEDTGDTVKVSATDLDIRNLTSTDVVTVTGGAGQVADVKVTLDSESVAVASIAVGDNNIGNVDIVTLPAGNLGQQAMAASLSVVPANNITDATYLGDIKFGESLPAGSSIIGKVGIDQTTPGTTNRVDVGAVIPGTDATNLGKAIDSVAGATDTGVAVLAVRDDALSALTPIEGDYANLRVDANGNLWVNLGVRLDKVNDSILAYGNTAKDGTGTNYVPLLDTDGHAQVDALSLPSGNLGQQAMAASLSTVPANNIADATYIGDIKFGEALPTGTNTFGACKDAGFNQTIVHKVVNSADATGIIDISDAPSVGQKLVLVDILISTDTAMNVTVLEETSGTVMHGPIYLAANAIVQVTTRATPMSKLATADKKYRLDASVAGNVTVETWTFSEA